MQGIGVAAMIPPRVCYLSPVFSYQKLRYLPQLQLGILAQLFPPSRARSLAFATYAVGASIGAEFGTVVGEY
jgi:hypothetical protein